jgi:hypothetical protein
MRDRSTAGCGALNVEMLVRFQLPQLDEVRVECAESRAAAFVDRTVRTVLWTLSTGLWTQ